MRGPMALSSQKLKKIIARTELNIQKNIQPVLTYGEYFLFVIN